MNLSKLGRSLTTLAESRLNSIHAHVGTAIESLQAYSVTVTPQNPCHTHTFSYPIEKPLQDTRFLTIRLQVSGAGLSLDASLSGVSAESLSGGRGRWLA